MTKGPQSGFPSAEYGRAYGRTDRADGRAQISEFFAQWWALPWISRSVRSRTGEAVTRYTGDWITSVTEETQRMKRIHALLAAGNDSQARALLPDEPPYPLRLGLQVIVGATG